MTGQKVTCTAEVIRNGQTIMSYDGLIDVKCNEGYIVFLQDGGMNGVIFLPERGDMIKVTTVEATQDVESYQ